MDEIDQKIEIYGIFVRTITATENRRQQASTIYLGIIVAVFTAAGAVGDMPSVLPAVATLCTSIIWLVTVRYFRRLAQAKFAVIKRLESDLPFAPFELEWQEVVPKRKLKVGLTQIEMIAPATIGAIALFYVIWFLVLQLWGILIPTLMEVPCD